MSIASSTTVQHQHTTALPVNSTATTADIASVSAFLNALVREWDGWILLSADQIECGGGTDDFMCFPLVNGDRLLITISGQTVFRCIFALPFRFHPRSGSSSEINVTEALTKLILDPVISPGRSDHQHLLLRRVLDSCQAMHVAEREKPVLDRNPARWNFQHAEQALTFGHPTHPNPRSKDELSTIEARCYAPELGARYPLFWSLVHESLLDLTSGTHVPVSTMCQALAASDGKLTDELRSAEPESGWVPLPWHPWQAKHLLQLPVVLDGIRRGLFMPLGAQGLPFAALSSFRGAHAFHAPYMLKFSLSLRLTNSHRLMAHKEVERGVQLATLLSGALGDILKDEFADVCILQEPGYVALRDDTGKLLEESLVVFRDNPFRSPEVCGPIVLASLCEFNGDGTCPLVDLIADLATSKGRTLESVAKEWLVAFVQKGILPVLELRARHGLLFGAHQQNMMIELADGWPQKVWLRDNQGTGHLTTHHAHLKAFLPDIGADAANVISPELGDRLLSYYVIVNNLMHVVSTLALHGLINEHTAYDMIRSEITAARTATTGDTAFYDKLLADPTLVSKGNYRTSLSNVNEASGDGSQQLAAFFDLPNPIALARNIP